MKRRYWLMLYVILFGAGPVLAQSARTLADNRGQAVTDLPFAQGRSFATLDDYLAYRAARGASDVPWYREVAPGIYELAGRRGPGAPAKRFTRAELMAKFGFAR